MNSFCPRCQKKLAAGLRCPIVEGFCHWKCASEFEQRAALSLLKPGEREQLLKYADVLYAVSRIGTKECWN